MKVNYKWRLITIHSLISFNFKTPISLAASIIIPTSKKDELPHSKQYEKINYFIPVGAVARTCTPSA